MKGFTLLETLLIIVIFSVVAVFSLLSYQTQQVRNDLNSQAKVLVSYLRLAQNNQASGSIKFNAMHLDSNAFVTFGSTSYEEGNMNNTVLELPPTINIDNINLNGGGTDIIFSGPEGSTSNYGSFTITASQINKSIPITVTSIGQISY